NAVLNSGADKLKTRMEPTRMEPKRMDRPSGGSHDINHRFGMERHGWVGGKVTQRRRERVGRRWTVDPNGQIHGLEIESDGTGVRPGGRGTARWDQLRPDGTGTARWDRCTLTVQQHSGGISRLD